MRPAFELLAPYCLRVVVVVVVGSLHVGHGIAIIVGPAAQDVGPLASRLFGFWCGLSEAAALRVLELACLSLPL